jgi:hypothetical protein
MLALLVLVSARLRQADLPCSDVLDGHSALLRERTRPAHRARSTPSLKAKGSSRNDAHLHGGSALPAGVTGTRHGARMEPAGATGGNHSQMGRPRKRLKHGDRHPVATHGNGCDGKEGVNGSSPLEGSAKAPHVGALRSGQLVTRRFCGGYGAVYGAFASETPARCFVGRPSTGVGPAVRGREGSALVDQPCPA